MAQFVFGSGILWGTPLTDASGNSITTPSPVQFGTLQDCAVDFSFDTKLLHGQKQFAEAVGRGKGKISGKAKFAQINGATVNSLFFGQTMTSGIVNDVYDVTGQAIPSTPFAITVAPPNSGTWAYDLGVRDSNGLPMTRVASAPAAGQYSVAAAVYTFAAADTGKVVFINYNYAATSTIAKKINIVNMPMGYAPSFQADFLLPFSGKSLVLKLPNCIGAKFAIATKQDDFVIPEFDFEAFADPAGNVASWSMSE